MKLLVSTKRGITRRRRAGHDFGQDAQVVDCDEVAKAWEAQLVEAGANPGDAKRSPTDVVKAITGDDSLNVSEVADDHEVGVMPKLDTAAVVKLTAEVKAKDDRIAELEAKLAEALSKIAPSDGSRERTGGARSGR